MVIQHNISSWDANRNLGIVDLQKSKSMEKLASGYRINRSGDDAAGLAISEKMRGQIRGINQASVNVETGISLVQAADGAMQEVSDILVRMRTLGVQAANDTNTDDDREQLQKEVLQLKSEINRIGKHTEFNTLKILQGKGGGALDVWIPDSEKDIQQTISKYTLVNFKDTDGFDDTPKFDPAKQGITGVSLSCSKTLDFSNITNDNKNLLIGAGFQFGCSQNCGQSFYFKFVEKVDCPANKYQAIGNQYGVYDKNYATPISTGQPKSFEVAIDKFTSGEEMVRNITEYVKEMNKIDGQTGGNIYKVGHANYLFADGGKLVIGGTGSNAFTNNSSRKYKLFHSDNLSDIIVETTEEVKGHWTTIYPDPLSMRIQAGANAGQEYNLLLPQIDERALKISDIDVSTHEKASKALDTIDSAVDYVNEERARIGAYQNRMEHAVRNLDNVAENLEHAESGIRDTDMAEEMVTTSKLNILQQAGVSILASANQLPQNVQQLLG